MFNYKDKVKSQFAMRRGFKAILVVAVLGLSFLGVFELQKNVEDNMTHYLYGANYGSLEAKADTLHALKAPGQE